MLKDVTIGQFFPGNSFLHRLDPRSKILGVMIYMITLFIINNFWAMGAMVLLSIYIIWVSRVPIRFFFRGIKAIILVVMMTVVLQMFMTPGEELWSWGFLTLTVEGIHRAIFMGTRLVLLVSVTSILTLTTTPIALTDGIETLLRPFQRFGVPAHELAMMMSIALRFIPTLIEETDKIMKAQAARGADFESGNLIERAKAMIPLMVPLFLNAFKRAEELAMAMEARCYHGGEGRTRLKALKYGRIDRITGVFCTLMFIAAIGSRFIP